MKHLLNTLYVTTEGTYLARRRETVEVRKDKKALKRFPIHLLGGIVCFGKVGASPALMGLCGERDVALSFLSTRGRFLARVQGPVSGNVLLRREHYRRADDPKATATIARSFLAGKILNCRKLLQRSSREAMNQDHGEVLAAVADRLADLASKLEGDLDLDQLRGLEGEAARSYFGVFDALVRVEGEEFAFEKRSRRPPLNRVNALLSFLYTLLFHDAVGALEGIGLDPAVGFLHRDRPGRKGLALDLMEEMRPVLADRVALSLINRKQVQADGFEVTESGAVLMNDATRATVLEEYQLRKQREILHPFTGEKVHFGLVMHLQANLLARYLRGDLDGYPPFFWR